MSYEWKHYLNFANGLLKDGTYSDSSTNYRVAISRAYYAAYHIALAFIEVHNLPKGRTGASHERVINAYSTMDRKDSNFKSMCKSIGYNLRRLRDRRNKADYDGNCNCTESDAKFAVNLAENIISKIETLGNKYFQN